MKRRYIYTYKIIFIQLFKFIALFQIKIVKKPRRQVLLKIFLYFS